MTTPITDQARSAVVEAAGKATPGGRYAVERDNGGFEIRVAGSVTIATVFHPPGHTSEDEATFIVRACSTILAYEAKVVEQAERIEALEGALRDAKIEGKPTYHRRIAGQNDAYCDVIDRIDALLSGKASA